MARRTPRQYVTLDEEILRAFRARRLRVRKYTVEPLRGRTFLWQVEATPERGT